MARGETGVVIRVLGPLEVVVDGRPVPLGSPQLRRLLVTLVVERDEVVSVDRLVEVLWGDAPPVRASGALQTLVYRLRAALAAEDTEAGRDVVVTRPPGYVLEVSADTVDAARFEATVSDAQSVLRAGDAPGALKLFEEALALWRGPALAEFGFEDFARSEAARLDELRVTATEDRVEARLTLGYHAELVGELEALVDAYPFRERLWAQLMLALYRAGRQREAVRAFGRLKALLGEELGLEPSTALRDLEQAIILQEPELDWTAPTNTATAPATADTPGTSAPVPGNLPLQVSSFIGRERDIARTVDALAVARLVTLTGTGGVGKTRLACQVAAEVSPGYRDG
ncbi:MAG TPA: BTAD domain-containing putative transcriptional regulator, partial [Mycobacterium sp.]|nr:BTAD domain-containing putative transcriptional regulator [Mycobacterium sp.]